MERATRLRLGFVGLVTGVLLTAAPEASAIIIRDDVPDTDYIVEDADYPAIVTLFPPDDCAATLFHESHLVTVAHCAVDLSAGDSLQVGGTASTVAEVTLHPMWTDGDNYDIAVVRLEEAVSGVDPLPLYRGADEMGAEVTLVGRGTTGTGIEGENGGNNDAVLRRATNIVTSVEALLFEVVFDAPADADVTELEGVGASGDSGGPVFLDVDGVPHVAGLNAFGDAPNGVGIGQYGGMDYQTRVSAFVDWVDEVVAGAEEPGDTDGPGGDDTGSSSSGDEAGSGGDQTSTGGDDSGTSSGSSATDSGGPGETDSESGCGCRSDGSPAAPWALLLCGFVMTRRRRPS